MEAPETTAPDYDQLPNGKWYVLLTLIIFSIIGAGFAYGVINTSLYKDLLGGVIYWHKNVYLGVTLILSLYAFFWNRKKHSLLVLLLSYGALSLAFYFVYWVGSFENLPSWHSDYTINSIIGFLLMSIFTICAWSIFYFKNKYSKIGFWLSVAFVSSKIVILILFFLVTAWKGLFGFGPF